MSDGGFPDKGTYTLVIRVEEPTTVTVGALGDIGFDDGVYAYTGSAFGTGGLSRVDRHKRVASGENDARHWHIDYLLGDDATALVSAIVTDENAECEIARSIDGEPVLDFGCSDCSCRSHLKLTTQDSAETVYGGRDTWTRRFR
ncbi:GIY-YIG nuclease family protein [Haladaptatus sp. F3-133]|uniref:GIY-YIG nuclease family protein n=1 Tax=Halorutilus salinus TaxID=2487751 RepID=A0A9Q4C335_9EURY|nr:GIY-YIG nuclease family protein [Halorutilus salinus]